LIRHSSQNTTTARGTRALPSNSPRLKSCCFDEVFQENTKAQQTANNAKISYETGDFTAWDGGGDNDYYWLANTKKYLLVLH